MVATPQAGPAAAPSWRTIRDVRRDDRAFVFILTVLAGVIYWATNPERVELDGFVPLADALLHGHLYIGPEYGYLEHAPGPAGGGYMPYPPAPVLFVLPVVALFGPTVDQSIAAAIIGAANILLLWLVFVRLDVTPVARCWLLAAFAFGSVHWWAAGEGTVWLFAHISAVFFALSALVARLARHTAVPGRLLARARGRITCARRSDDAAVPRALRSLAGSLAPEAVSRSRSCR